MVIERKRIDEADSKILHALLMESRTSFTELARVLGVSVTAVLRRYNKLKGMGVICGEHMHLNPLSAGCQSMAEVGITTDLKNKEKVAEILSNRKLAVANTSLGKYDIYGDIFARRTDELWQLVQRLDIKQYVKSVDVLIHADLNRTPWHPENLCIKPFDSEKKIERNIQSIGSDPFTLDERDECIVKMLVENSRIPFKEIAQQMNIPIKSVFQKYKCLREKSVLYLSTITINPAMLGFQAVYDLYVNVETRGMLSNVEGQLLQIPNMTFCRKFVGGAYDMRAAFLVSDIAEIFEIKKILHSLENIKKIECYLHELPNRWFSIRQSLRLIEQLCIKRQNQ